MEITNPAFNYDKLGQTYSGFRQTDPRIAKFIHAALGNAATVLNVGAGAGSYEPTDRYVVSVEPSRVMRAQREGKVPALIGKADSLPFDDLAFDASMAMVTVHHWPDIEKGLKEMRRVTRNAVLILTFDPDALHHFWNASYFPELVEVERKRYPKLAELVDYLGGTCDLIKIPVPVDCLDGFQEAYYARPEAFLEQEVRRAQSAWGFLEEGMEEVLVKRLADDLGLGEWERKYGFHRTLPEFTGALTLLVAHP